MTLHELQEKVRTWDFQHTGAPEANSKYGMILAQLSYHAQKEWRTYLPAEHPDFNPDYMERLAAWIGNVESDADQRLLLEYALFISFLSHDDFVALYRTAMEREIWQWVAGQVSARLEPSGWSSFHSSVLQEIHDHTWFCPVTDSMDINEFYKVNHLKGVGHRPGFATLEMLAERAGKTNEQLPSNILFYMQNPRLSPDRPGLPLRRIVLLEDIVGSGVQCLDAVRWAVAKLNVPVLLVPLILCPNGVQVLRQEEGLSNGKLTVRPVIELERGDLLGPERRHHQGWPLASEMEGLAWRVHPRLQMGAGSAFGYNQTGCSIVTFANTPDNSLPMIHTSSPNGMWQPLFPRVYRD